MPAPPNRKTQSSTIGQERPFGHPPIAVIPQREAVSDEQHSS